MNARATNRAAPRLLLAALAVATPSLALAALAADNEPRSLLIGGGFEHGAVSLRLPAVSPFPLVMGGWGARLQDGEITVLRTPGREGRVLQIDSRARSATHAIQDVALASRAFILQIDVQRLRGQQTIALLSDWDRIDPDTDTGLRIDLRAAGLRVHTAQESWRIRAPLDGREWVRLGLLSDPRSGQLQVEIDGALVAMLPVVPAAPVRTVVLGGNPGKGASRFRYDSASLLHLGEVELAELRRAAIQRVPEGDLEYVMRRLDDAALAIGNGADAIAGAELRAVARLLARADTHGTDEGDLAPLSAAAELIAELLAAD